MSNQARYDPRAVANLLLDEADRRGVRITNLVLQKLLYFAHAQHLAQRGISPLSGYFEAWALVRFIQRHINRSRTQAISKSSSARRLQTSLRVNTEGSRHPTCRN